jgi:RNA polymerase sigma-70 factor (ECF subfamily)
MPDGSGQVTALLTRLRRGDQRAAEQLVPLVMDELRRLARHYLRDERTGHTLQPTALVHEAYLKLAGYQNLNWESRSHFIGVAASLMRQILIDSARRHRAAKRGRHFEQVSLDEHRDFLQVERSEELLALDEALHRLEKMNSRQSRIVELRYFGGLSVEETAEALRVSPITVKREWATARAWLRAELEVRQPAGQAEKK